MKRYYLLLFIFLFSCGTSQKEFRESTERINTRLSTLEYQLNLLERNFTNMKERISILEQGKTENAQVLKELKKEVANIDEIMGEIRFEILKFK